MKFKRLKCIRITRNPGVQRAKAAVPACPCVFACASALCSPSSPVFEVMLLLELWLHLCRELSVSSSIPFGSRVQSPAWAEQRGSRFSTQPELGQAEMVPWEPCEGVGLLLLGSPSLQQAGEGAALAHRESMSSAGPLKLLPARLTQPEVCGLIRSQLLSNSLTRGALTRAQNRGVNL